jgi:large subunit ribosomal protein L29
MASNAALLRTSTEDDLERQLKEAKEELFNLRFQAATGQLESHGRLRTVRRDIARIYTILRERELGIIGFIEPATDEPGADEPDADEPAADEAATDETDSDAEAAEEPKAKKSTAKKSAAKKTTAKKSTAKKATAKKSAAKSGDAETTDEAASADDGGDTK